MERPLLMACQMEGDITYSSWTKSFQSGIYFKAQGTIKNNGDLVLQIISFRIPGTMKKTLTLPLKK